MPNESGEMERGREGLREEIGRSGYYHGTPLFPPPSASAADPLGGTSDPCACGAKSRGCLTRKRVTSFIRFLQPSKDDDRERLQSTKSAMTELQKSINWFCDGLGKLMMINDANFII